jgi:hypothetical protein
MDSVRWRSSAASARLPLAATDACRDPSWRTALMEGIRMAGIDTIDVGCVPTPVVYFAAHELGCQSCVAVTGSHNPPDYNGLKMVIGGETLAGEAIQGIRQRVDAGCCSTAAARRAAPTSGPRTSRASPATSAWRAR